MQLVMAGYRVYTPDGSLYFESRRSSAAEVSPERAIGLLYEGWPYGYQGYLWTKLFRAAVIRRHGLRFDTDLSFNEDRLFVVRYVCAEACRVCFATDVVYNYRQRDTSAMQSLVSRFNHRFITDLYAYERMLAVVRRLGQPRLTLTAKVGIYQSACHIRYLVDRFAVDDASAVRAEVRRVVRRNLGCRARLWAYYHVVVKAKLRRNKDPRVALAKVVSRLRRLVRARG